MDCSPPVSSVHGILQARILELPLPSPGDLPNPGIKLGYLTLQAVFTIWATREVQHSPGYSHFTQWCLALNKLCKKLRWLNSKLMDSVYNPSLCSNFCQPLGQSLLPHYLHVFSFLLCSPSTNSRDFSWAPFLPITCLLLLVNCTCLTSPGCLESSQFPPTPCVILTPPVFLLPLGRWGHCHERLQATLPSASFSWTPSPVLWIPLPTSSKISITSPCFYPLYQGFVLAMWHVYSV